MNYKAMTIAQVQRAFRKTDGPLCPSWSLSDHLVWYHHRVKVGKVGRSFAVVQAAVSRNKREGKLIGVYKGQLVRNFGNRLFTNDANPSTYRAMHGLRRRRYGRGDFKS